MKRKDRNCIILASGNGSNAVNLINHFMINKKGNHRVKISAVISNIGSAPVIGKVKELAPAMPIFVIPFKNISEREGFEEKLSRIIADYRVDFIILAGFMKVLSEDFVLKYPRRIINIHPSLLPKFKGKDAIIKAFENGEKYTGVTVHFVTPEVDSGPVILQERVRIEEKDSVESLEERIHRVEHRIYPDALEQAIKNESDG